MRKRREYFIWGLVSFLLVIAGGEAFARFYLGLGTPPLSMTHPKIEYMFKPNQNVYRFGNHFVTNQYGMRSMPFPAVKKVDDEYRIMVFGDSVINGGNQTDHSALATTLVNNRLSEVSKNNFVVGNISAGSWGPGNWLAYANEFGFFGSDFVVVVISSHDYVDNPTFQTLNTNTHPTEKPISALSEGITRYLPRYLPNLWTGGKSATDTDRFAENIDEQEAKKGLDDLRRFLELAKSNSTNVLVFQHWEKSEIENGFSKAGNQKIKEICGQIDITTVSLEPIFRHSIESGVDPFRDNVHPNEAGQQLIAQAILDNLPTNNAGFVSQ